MSRQSTCERGGPLAPERAQSRAQTLPPSPVAQFRGPSVRSQEVQVGGAKCRKCGSAVRNAGLRVTPVTDETAHATPVTGDPAFATGREAHGEEPHGGACRELSGATGRSGHYWSGRTALSVVADELLEQLAGDRIGILPCRALHKVGGCRLDRATEPGIERDLGGAYGVDHDPGGVR